MVWSLPSPEQQAKSCFVVDTLLALSTMPPLSTSRAMTSFRQSPWRSVSSAYSPANLQISRALLSTHRARLADQRSEKMQQPESNKQSSKPAPENPSMPAFSLQGLGATRTVKIVVLCAIGIMGTMETIFYTKVAWNYLFPSGDTSTPPYNSCGINTLVSRSRS